MKKVKFIHCADIHLDMPFKYFDNKSKMSVERRRDIKDTLKRIISFAEDHKVDFIIISGDLLENDYISKGSIYFLDDLFKSIKDINIFIIPGNHDPYLKNSYYNTFDWSENVHIFNSEKRKIVIDNYCVYGAAFNDFYEDKPLISDVEKVDNNLINILGVHGTVDMNIGNSLYNPMNSEDLDKLEMDYIALGHFHNTLYKIGRNKNIFNPGSPEPLKFTETGEHGVFMASIEKDDIKTNLEVEFIKMSRCYYKNIEIDVGNCFTDDQIIVRIKKYLIDEDLKRGIFQIILNGYIDKDFTIDKDYINNSLYEKLYYLKIVDGTEKDYDIESLKNEQGLVGIFTRKLLTRIEESDNDDEKTKLKKALYYGLEAINKDSINIM